MSNLQNYINIDGISSIVETVELGELTKTNQVYVPETVEQSIVSAVYSLSSSILGVSSDIENTIDEKESSLQEQIDNKFMVSESPTDELQNGSNLSVRIITTDEFHDLVTGNLTAFEPNTVYIMTQNELNAYNSRVRNVGYPEEAGDAVNKNYVDMKFTKLVEQLKIYGIEVNN